MNMQVYRKYLWYCLSWAVLLSACAAPGLAGDDDPFSLANKAVEKTETDPFSRANQASLSSQPKAEVAAPVSPLSRALSQRIRFEVKVEPLQARRGEVVKVVVTGKPKAGFHTYPIARRTPNQPSQQLSKLDLQTSKWLKPLWPIIESKADFVDTVDGILLEHDREFTWTQDVLVLPDARPLREKIGVHIRLMVCDDNGCVGPGDYLPLEATVDIVESPATALSAELKNRIKQPEPPVQLVQVPAEVAATLKSSGSAKGPAGTKAADNSRSDSTGNPADLLGLLGAAFIGAFLMLLTPCVFPMIPITVNFFLKQSEKEHHRPLAVASVYSGTIIILLTLVMLALGGLVIRLANDPWFNLGLGLVLIYFAFSLFGMYEIELPSGLARFTSAREGQGGFVGAIFMALTFTITSFTCTGPFLGAMLAPVAGIQPPRLYLILAALVYSATFAAPFFVLALFPSMMKKLPKSGGWLNAIKVTMGFLELGAALKFLANTDIAWFPGNPRLFNYDTVLCSWIALSVACGLYLFGFFRLPHDDKVEHVGALRMVIGTIFLGLSLYMLPALYGEKPRGVIGENLVAFLPPRFGGAAAADKLALSWHLDYIDGWNEATRDKKRIFIDFTGVTCTNCRDNEENVFPKPAVEDLLKKYVRVRLFTDTVPKVGLSPSEAEAQATRNARWRDAIADPTNPTYVILNPDSKAPFTEAGLLNGDVLDKRNGKIWDINGFVAFLREGEKVAPQLRALQPRSAPLATR